jgi:hypothetical protein
VIQGNYSAATSAADDDDDDDYDSDDCDEEEEEEEEEEENEEDEDEEEDNDNDDEVVDIASRADYFVKDKVEEKACYHDVCVDGEKDEDEVTEDNDDDEDDETDEEEDETEEEEEDVLRVESISKKGESKDRNGYGEDKDLDDDHTLHEYGVENILKVDEKHENESCDGTVNKSDNMVESNASCTYTDVSARLVDAECCPSKEEKEVKGEVKEVTEEVKIEEKEEVVVEVRTEENADADVSVNDVSQKSFLTDMM